MNMKPTKAELIAEIERLRDECVEQRCIGHGDGQMHAVEDIAQFVEHLRDDYVSSMEPVTKVARLIRERFGTPSTLDAVDPVGGRVAEVQRADLNLRDFDSSCWPEPPPKASV